MADALTFVLDVFIRGLRPLPQPDQVLRLSCVKVLVHRSLLLTASCEKALLTRKRMV